MPEGFCFIYCRNSEYVSLNQHPIDYTKPYWANAIRKSQEKLLSKLLFTVLDRLF
jgi:hypothetical protein